MTLIKAQFTASPMAGKAPLEVTFTDHSPGASSWSWDFGDGTDSTEQNPVHSFTIPGTYRVTLRATIGDDMESVTKTVWVV
jgi:PKD repeat protein